MNMDVKGNATQNHVLMKHGTPGETEAVLEMQTLPQEEPCRFAAEQKTHFYKVTKITT